MKYRIEIALIGFGLIAFTACGEVKNSNVKSNGEQQVLVENAFIDHLEEKQLGQSAYFVSLPEGYVVKETQGADFDVYHFFFSDTADNKAFTAGVYLGGHPDLFKPYNDSCITSETKSLIMDSLAEWTIYNCNGAYAIQTLVDSKSVEAWNPTIHAFGNAGSEEEMKKVLAVFSTLKKK